MTTESQRPLAGLRVAITGGTSGLGLALVRALHEAGARVAFVARTEARVNEVAGRHAGTHGITGDVSKKDTIHPLAMRITAALGGLDVLIHNASSLGPCRSRRWPIRNAKRSKKRSRPTSSARSG
jgi:NAD(P)-dependent dehydrogenase (short-subunit alcohol dehydrogenase family)